MKSATKGNVKDGIFCAALISRFNGTPIEIEQLQHLFGGYDSTLTMMELANTFKEMGLDTSTVKKAIGGLKAPLFPIIAQKKTGEFVLLAKSNKELDQVLVHEAGSSRASWTEIKVLQREITDQVLFIKKGHAGQEQEQFGFGWFLKAAKKYWSILRDCLLASMFVQVFALLSPLVFMIVIDKVLGNNSLSTLDVLVFALLVVSLFEAGLSGLRTYLLSHTANRIDLMLGVRVFKHLMCLPLSYFETRQVGDTVARMKELENIRQFITGSGLMLFLDLFFLVVFVVVMFLFSPFLTSIVLGTMPFLFGVSFILTPFLRDKLEDKYSTNSANQSFLVESIGGIQTIKSSAAERRVQKQWEDKLTHHVKNGFKSGHLANLINQSTTIISKLLSVLLLWFGAKEVLSGNLTVGQLIAFNMLSSRVIAPIIRLSQIWKELQQVKISITRIGDIFTAPQEPGFEMRRVSLPEIEGRVEFDRVSFKYQKDGLDVLTNLSFTVKPGEVVGIVGSTGSGKTTIAKLAQRLYVPDRGRVLVDGVDLSTVDASWLRRQIGVVVQDNVLFNTSIRNNIALNSPELDIEELIMAARLAGVHSFVSEMPHGYDTPVGERGIYLSTGQRQRLAIARALATNPRMLILDEATSALDYESELLIQQNMKDICKDRTVIIIAHRLSTLRHADRIITLERGEIIENDTPERLLASAGRFAQLHTIQEGGYAH